MKSEDVTIERGGTYVTCAFHVPSRAVAHQVHEYAEDNPPLGYVLLRFGCSRRRKGGVKRFLRLSYEHTGNAEYPPMDSWEAWDATLFAEQRIIRDSLGLKRGEEG